MSLKRALIVAVACAVVVGVVGAFVWHGTFTNDTSASPGTHSFGVVQPDVPPNVALRQNASAIEQQVRKSLGVHSVVTSVRVVAHRREIGEALIGGTGPEFKQGGPAWIVRARGLFRPVTVPPGGHFIEKPRSGYFVIDDRTGRTLAYGFD